MMKKIFPILTILFFAIQIHSQSTEVDTVKNYSYEEIVVTGNRYETFLLESTSSINKVSLQSLRHYPVRDLVSTFQFVPGFYSANLDGLGKLPVITVRGFYGGGEAEYLNFIVDGIETNYAQNGLANWQILPIASLDNIEILRGGASSAYGDASIGGVININTTKGLERNVLSISGGDFGQINTSLYRNSFFGNNQYSIYGSFDNSSGFREHSEWMLTSFGGNVEFDLSENAKFSLITHNQINKYELPGSVTEDELKSSRTFSSPYNKYDEKDEKRFIISPKLDYGFGKNEKLSLQLGLKNQSENKTQTFTNSAPIINPSDFSIIGVYDTTLFGDTKKRELKNTEYFSELLFRSNLDDLPLTFIVGAKANYSDYTSDYYNFYNGFKEDYVNSNASAADKVLAAEGNRTELSAFLNSTIEIIPNLHVDLGLRYDDISDEYTSSKPDSAINSDNSSFSPKIGLNFLYSNSLDYKASIYMNYNRSFKAPTIDQLTDLKQLDFLIFIPTGPSSFMSMPFQAEPFANSNLKPQKSSNYEIGSYQSIRFTKDIILELQLSLYQIDIEDEIDFDLSSFKYQNIAETRHKGIEFGAHFSPTQNFTVMTNYTLSKVTFESGANEGNQLKGIPEHVINFGGNYQFDFGLSIGVLLNSVNTVYLDDENTALLNNFITSNAKLGYKWNDTDISLSVYNLFDEEYISTGYLANGVSYFYPAAGRYIIAGVNYVF